MNQQRMPVSHPNARLEWRTIAVTATDPMEFAKELEGALQELTDMGFIITSQMPRDRALIITASRPVGDTMLTVPTGVTPLPRRRAVALPTASARGKTTEEVLYHFVHIPTKEQKQRRFPSLVEALRCVREHLDGGENLPYNITTVSMTAFTAKSLPVLLRMFADDLKAPLG